MEIITLTSNPFQVNTYIVVGDNNEAIIIDPGCSSISEKKQCIDEIQKRGLLPKKILLTHAHIDHILGAGYLQQFFKIDVLTHKDSAYFLNEAMDSARLFGLTLDSLPFVEHYLDDKQTIGIAGIDMKILETPGHAAGSLCFYAEKQNVIFTGDVLFMQSIGRTDLPTGNHKQLLENITTKLLSLPENTVVYPGHGQPTTIGEEKQFNPFF